MTTLSERVAAIMARVTAEVPTAQWAETSRERVGTVSPPHILWERRNGSPVRAGQLHSRATPYQRAVLGRGQGYAVTVHGNDWPQVDALRAALDRACEAEAAGAWAFVGDRATDASLITAGEAVTVDLVLSAHTPEPEPVTVEITSARIRRNPSAAPNDGVLEPGDP